MNYEMAVLGNSRIPDGYIVNTADFMSKDGFRSGDLVINSPTGSIGPVTK